MCKSKQVLETKYVASDNTQEGGEGSDELGMYYIEKSKHKREQPATETGREGDISQISVTVPKYTVEVTIGEQPIGMEVDTGIVVSVVSE